MCIFVFFSVIVISLTVVLQIIVCVLFSLEHHKYSNDSHRTQRVGEIHQHSMTQY